MSRHIYITIFDNMNVRLNKDQKIRVLNSDDLYNVMQQILLRENKIRRNQEHFWTIGLDKKNKILFIELIGLGANNRVAADPPDVFRMAIYKLASKVILAHNHPSGVLEPSKADLNFTDKMLKSGQILNVEVIDHIIISESGYMSFDKEGYIKTIKNSGMYEVMNVDKARMVELKLSIEKEKLLKENSKKIAKKMKDQGMDEKLIKKMTGLYLDEIRAL